MEEIKYVFVEDEPVKRPVGKPKGTKGGGRPRKLPEQRMPGRPQSYTEDIANEICDWLATGKSLTSYCSIPGKPSYSTIMRWIWQGNEWYKEDFFKRYTEARKQQAQCLADQLIDISDDGKNDYMELEDKSGKKYIKVNGEYIQRSRLRIEVRQWIAKSLLPKVYGDKSGLTLTGEGGGPVTLKVIYEDAKQPEKKDD
jgi:hypothetical protein